MNTKDLIENIDSIIDCARAIKNDTARRTTEGSDLYERLRDGGYSIHYEEIVAALHMKEQGSSCGVEDKYDAAHAFEVWREWRESGLSELYEDLDSIKSELGSYERLVHSVSIHSGLSHLEWKDDIDRAIDRIKGDQISPTEKALLTAVKAFIAATQE